MQDVLFVRRCDTIEIFFLIGNAEMQYCLRKSIVCETFDLLAILFVKMNETHNYAARVCQCLHLMGI